MGRCFASGAIAVFMLAAAHGAVRAQAVPTADTVSLDNLLSVASVIGGRDAPQWSPDGSRIMFMSSMRGGLNLFSISPEGGFPVLLAEDVSLVGTGSPGSQKPQWSPDGRWIAYVSSKGGAPEIWLWSAADGRDIQLTDLGGRVNAITWSPHSNMLVLSNDRYGSQDIWKVSVPDGRLQRLTSDSRYEVYPSWTPDGRILYVRMDDQWVDHDVFEMSADGGEPRLVVEDRDFFDYRAGLSFGTPLASPDGGQILFRSLRSGWHNFWVVPRQGGAPRAIATASADQSHARWSPDGRWIAYTENHNGTVDLRIVSADGGEARVLVAPQGMGVVDKPEWSPDGTRISYTLTTPSSPEDLYVIDVATAETRRLTHSMPAGELEERWIEPEKVSYGSTEGLTINGYLYRPPGLRAGQRVPAIVWVHGGPTSQFDDGFGRHRDVQYFVQRGYAVLMPNVRGSSGYGKNFEDANNRCWGRCDLEDVLAGVDYLGQLPYVNTQKVGITGTSYGGILSMAAVAFAPGVFQAAIPISGYGDYTDFHTTVPELQHIRLLEYELGPYPEEEQLYRSLSPIHYVENATAPTLLLHGYGLEVDWRPGQADPEMAALNFARALDQAYKIYRYKAYPGETYYVYSRENTKQKLIDMLEFFEQFLNDGSAIEISIRSLNLPRIQRAVD